MGVFRRKDSPFWWIWLDGTKRRENTKIPIDAPTEAERKENRKLAETAYAARMGDLARARYDLPGARPAKTFAPFAAWFDSNVLEHRSGKEREREILPRLVAAFGALPLDAITKARVQEWATERLRTSQTLKPIRPGGKERTAPPPSPRTVNREIDLLKTILQAAVPTYLASSPLYGMKRLRVTKPKRRLMTEVEERRILPHLSSIDRAIFLLALDSLLRLGDILDLKHADVKDDRVYIAAPKDPKQPEPFWVPISARARRALAAVPRVEGSPYIFAARRRAKTERDRRNAFAHALRRACAAANVPYGRTEGGVTFHWATRRTGATRMLNRDVPLATVQKVGHWQTADVLLGIYHELDDELAQRAVESVRPRRARRSRSTPTRSGKRRISE